MKSSGYLFIPSMTSQILMLSGIGIKSELEKQAIEQVVDLPVGKNLQDHPLVYAGFRIGNPNGPMTSGSAPFSFINPINLLKAIRGHGEWATNRIVIGFLQSKLAKLKKYKRPGEIINPLVLNYTTGLCASR